MASVTPIFDKPLVSIIILNWNGWKDTLECLRSVQKINYPNFRILVVDNGSSDESVTQIRHAFPDVELLETGKNLGYAGGNNAGIAHALSEQPAFILLLNNDTIVDPDILTAFVDAASSCPATGIFGAKSYYYSKPDIIWTLGGKWDSSTSEIMFICQGEHDSAVSCVPPFEVEYVIGCALFCRVDMIQKIGMMEESFFLNFEEMDWCYQARTAGYSSYAVPDAKLWHKVSVSFGGAESPLWNYFMTRNELLWARRHLSLRERMRVAKKILRRWLPGFSIGEPGQHGLAQRLYWETTRYVREINRRRHQPYYQAQFYGVMDYVCRRFGDCPSSIRKKLIAKPDEIAS
ncbi:glycosyltransferase family 2 protein [Candidatus Nitrotoga sp. M5]|uniref:glycosyltransferase family 2 protein n=1 Tax=Candidatus Nitrotoga sp. M5 TaxID=2890409 RepID=UPI001EF1C3A6|nr:glycosyltransferase family 2 protein [Candidatus Nitrotoga sp. M5]CAH1386235.1 Glyco_trans_2-like domain-containing protein [Candidatus Nitrotoga sp. M5]